MKKILILSAALLTGFFALSCGDSSSEPEDDPNMPAVKIEVGDIADNKATVTAALEKGNFYGAKIVTGVRVSTLTLDDFRDTRQRGVLGMVPGEIITTDNGYADHVDLEKDILKIAVVERHKGTHHIGLGYIQGYGLKSGAVATSISHDSHNIIVVGTNSADMAFAANYIVEHHGGIVVVENGTVKGDVVLEIAGIMSDRPLTEVNDQLEAAKDAAFTLGVSRGIDPFMTLSFMALPVIPKLRITTRGVIDVETQQYV